jgi:hypothetical protein
VALGGKVTEPQLGPDFFDLTAEERGYWYDKAEEETGSNFWDLPAEERGRYYDKATGREGSS